MSSEIQQPGFNFEADANMEDKHMETLEAHGEEHEPITKQALLKALDNYKNGISQREKGQIVVAMERLHGKKLQFGYLGELPNQEDLVILAFNVEERELCERLLEPASVQELSNVDQIDDDNSELIVAKTPDGRPIHARDHYDHTKGY